MAVLVLVLGFAFIGPTERSTFIIAVAFVPVLALTTVRVGAVQGLGSVIAARTPDDLVGPAAFVVFLVLAWTVFDWHKSAPIAMALQGLDVCVAFLVGLIVLRWALPSQIRPAAGRAGTRRWLRLAVPSDCSTASR